MKQGTTVTIAILTLWASTVFAAPCPMQDWSLYLGLAQGGMGCTIGNYSFSDFSFDAGTSGLMANKISAKPFGLGFQFDLMGFTVVNPIQGLTSSKSLTLDFKITDDTGVGPIQMETLNITGLDTNNGDVTIEDTENGFSANFLAGRTMADKSFTPPKAMLRVEHRLTVGTGMNQNATATISQYTVQFTPVPEASTLLLFGSSLIGLGAVNWRRIRRR